MNGAAMEEVDIAIIGGGVSGLYTAWRLAADAGESNKRIAVLEESSRLGGRLWSVGMRQENAIPAELGGMFFSDAQTLVYDLCTTELGLKRESVTSRPDFAYLRGHRFRIEDFDKPGILPYRLAPDEQGKAYHELLLFALRRILPELDDYWPLNPKSSPSELVRYLRNATYRDRPLKFWGFWNLLSNAVSNEAYLCLRDIVSSHSLFSNWNGRDAIFSIVMDLTGSWFRISDGYQRVADRLGERIEENGASIRLRSRVTRIDSRENGKLDVIFQRDGTQEKLRANHVVLALPKGAILSLDPNSVILRSPEAMDLLDSVESVAACKIFMTFNKPWWRDAPDGPGRIERGSLAISHTDLPMRQCYYLGTDPNTGEGLLLASYGDAQSVPFWSTLMTDSGRYTELETTVPPLAIDEICRQLSEMHDIAVPAPSQAIFVDWASPPFGGGWHAWRPGWDSRDVMAKLRKPLSGVNLHVCGEAYCAYQSWVEGALTSAEMLVQEQFGLSAPAWLTSSECLAPYEP